MKPCLLLWRVSGNLVACHCADLRILTREVLVGDRLLPVRERTFEYYFFPHAPPFPVESKIIAVVDGVSQIGQHQVVVLSLSAEEGIARGSVLVYIRQDKESIIPSATDREMKSGYLMSVWAWP